MDSVEFLTELIDKIKNDELTPNEQLHLYVFRKNIEGGGGDTNGRTPLPPTTEEMMKYLTMGWYVYSCIDK